MTDGRTYALTPNTQNTLSLHRRDSGILPCHISPFLPLLSRRFDLQSDKTGTALLNVTRPKEIKIL